MKKTAAVLSVLVAVLAAALAWRSFRPTADLDHPHIILIVIDTLRADHLGAYGHTRPTSPNIDKLAAQGVLYENAFSPTSWTVPAMATMFTGLTPQEHGVIEGLQLMGIVSYQHQLPEGYETLPERLGAAGFKSFGYSTNAHVSPQTGFGQGFEKLEFASTANSDEIERLLKRDLRAFADLDRAGKPYFLYMHFFDPHAPYMPREPYIKTVAPDFNYEALIDVNARQGDLMIGLPEGYFDEHPQQLQALMDTYDSEIAAADDTIGRILEMLPGSQRAHIIFVSDHGEAFWEHRSMLHGFDLFRETVRVPMILRAPITEGEAPAARRVVDPVGIIDVPTTILAIAGSPAGDLKGIDIRGDVPRARAFTFHLKRGPLESHGALTWPRKVIIDRFKARTMSFDLAADPNETNDLGEAGVAPELLAAAQAAWDVSPRFQPEMITNEHWKSSEQLKALGYLAPGAPARAATPAPKAPTPIPPWYIELKVCDPLRAIMKECAAQPVDQRRSCEISRVETLKEKVCENASSFNYRKKCEFMRLESTLARCDSTADKP